MVSLSDTALTVMNETKEAASREKRRTFTVINNSDTNQTGLRRLLSFSIAAIVWAAWLVSVSIERAGELRLTPQMHWSTPSCFSVLSYPLCTSFDRLVNNAGGLCDDNRLGGRTCIHKSTHSLFYFHIYIYIFPPIWLSWCSWSLSHSQLCLNLQFTPSSPPGRRSRHCGALQYDSMSPHSWFSLPTGVDLAVWRHTQASVLTQNK